MTKFKNKYRNESARASWWNYANDGAYFITICSAGREWLFGEISNNEMNLSTIGEIVYQEWNISFDMRAELFCDTFVIMPNHIHAILRIENGIVGTDGIAVGTHGPSVGTHGPSVGTHGRASQQDQTPTNTGVAYRSPKSISSFVAGFKSAATKRINEYRNSPKIPVWQPRFHDHIIRNESAYHRIYNYIEMNIEKWEKDQLFKKEE
jgi:putative transposase